MRTFARYFFPYFLAFTLVFSAPARAFVPLIPLAAAVLPSGGATVLETIAIGTLVTALALQLDQAVGVSPASVDISLNPNIPRPVPAGWGAPVPPATSPTPPLTAPSHSQTVLKYGRMGYALTDIDPNAICTWHGFGVHYQAQAGTYNGVAYTGICTNGTPIPWDYVISGLVPVAPSVLACDAGYTLQAGVCVLSNSSVVPQPLTGVCHISRVGNAYSLDTGSPDCSSSSLSTGLSGGTLSVLPSSVTVSHADGRRVVSTINADGTSTVVSSTPDNTRPVPYPVTTTTVGLSAPDAAGNSTVLSRTVAVGTSAVSAVPAAADPALLRDVAAIKDELSAVGATPALPVIPAVAALDAARATELSDFTNNFGGGTLPPLPAFHFPTFQPIACVAPTVIFQGKTITWDICRIVPAVKLIFAWVLNLLCAALCFSMLMRFRAMRVRG